MVSKLISINCDMGEGYGRYRLVDDSTLMPYANLLNVACGFHASDPSIMEETVASAQKFGVLVGAHPSLPDRQGFGRREMAMTRNEVAAHVRYQIGALKAFLDFHGAPLSHVKPHGALFAMATYRQEIAHGICDAVVPLQVPILGLAGTLHEEVYLQRGLPFIAEFYADLEYDEQGNLIYAKVPPQVDTAQAVLKVERLLSEGVVRARSGQLIKIRADSICVHSDGPQALELLRSIRGVVDRWNAKPA